MEYHGLTHIPVPKILLSCWNHFLCKRNIHLFDEVKSTELHYLSCDACDLMVIITSIFPYENMEGMHKILTKGTILSDKMYRKYIFDDPSDKELNTMVLHHDYVYGKLNRKHVFKRLGF